MKKVLLAVFVLVMVGGLTACSDQERIYVFNWGFFIYEPVLAMFEEEYGIRVIYDTYPTNEVMYARVVDGGGVFDVLVPSDYMIERMINEGLLAPINWDNIPNRRYIADRFWYWDHDPTNAYSVPYIWGTFGIVYNTNMIDQVVDSWSILWDEQFANNIFMYDSARCSLGVAQHLLGFSLNTRNIDEMHQVRDKLLSQSHLVRAFLGDEVIHSMIGEEAAIAAVFNGCARWIMDSNPNHNFVNPYEGVQLFIDSMVIPANAQNQAGAEKFINFMNRPDIAVLNALYIMYTTTNEGALALLPEDWQNCPIYWPPEDVIRRGEVFRDLGDFRAEYEHIWTQVLANR